MNKKLLLSFALAAAMTGCINDCLLYTSDAADE